MLSLRQKTYGIFIKPYIEYGGDYLVQRGQLFATSPCQQSGESCPSYLQVKDGENWVLYKGKYFTSFTLAKETVKELMENLGYSKNDICVTEVIPLDNIVTPLV